MSTDSGSDFSGSSSVESELSDDGLRSGSTQSEFGSSEGYSSNETSDGSEDSGHDSSTNDSENSDSSDTDDDSEFSVEDDGYRPKRRKRRKGRLLESKGHRPTRKSRESEKHPSMTHEEEDISSYFDSGDSEGALNSESDDSDQYTPQRLISPVTSRSSSWDSTVNTVAKEGRDSDASKTRSRVSSELNDNSSNHDVDADVEIDDHMKMIKVKHEHPVLMVPTPAVEPRTPRLERLAMMQEWIINKLKGKDRDDGRKTER
ncbi:MAG: hypothetical protein MHM6MM_000861 [Cercozoa sp. M6MM]